MKAIEMKMPDKVHRWLASLAARDRLAVDEFALFKLEELVRALEEFAELERRARRGSFDKLKVAMTKVRKTPPDPGDELPDGNGGHSSLR